jgi:hypothetical protein
MLVNWIIGQPVRGTFVYNKLSESVIKYQRNLVNQHLISLEYYRFVCNHKSYVFNHLNTVTFRRLLIGHCKGSQGDVFKMFYCQIFDSDLS